LIYGAIAKTFRAIPAALVIGAFSFVWLSMRIGSIHRML